MMKKNKKIGLMIILLSLFVVGFFSPFFRLATEGFTYPNDVARLKTSSSADFYAISESDYTTRWILQNSTLTAVENFSDDINTDYWNLAEVYDISHNETYLVSSNYLLDNYTTSTQISIIDYTGVFYDIGDYDTNPIGVCWDGTYFYVVHTRVKDVFKYYANWSFTGDNWDVGAQVYYPMGIAYNGTHLTVSDAYTDDVFAYTMAGVYTGYSKHVVNDPSGITWDGTYWWILTYTGDEMYKYYANWTYTGEHFNTGFLAGNSYGLDWDGTYLWFNDMVTRRSYAVDRDGNYYGNFYNHEDVDPTGICWNGTRFFIAGYSNGDVYQSAYGNRIYKNYFGGGYMYMQTDTTELIGLESIDYSTHYNLSSGDYFEVDLQTSSDSQINLILLKDGVVNKSLILSQSGNGNFNRHTIQLSVDEYCEFDQLKISSTFEDEDYVKIYDIKSYKYEIVGDYVDFYISSHNQRDVNLTSGTYNLRIFDPYDDGVKVDVNITLGTADYFYIYEPVETIDCRLTLFNTGKENHLDFEDYHISINRSLNGEWDVFNLLSNIFIADEESRVYINVSDSFDTLIDSFDKIVSSYIDLELDVYKLQIKSLLAESTTLLVNGTTFPLLSGDSLYFMLSEAYYEVNYTDEQSADNSFTIYLDSNQAYELNTSYHTVYIGLFTYDGLGLNRDWVRLYINDVRADFGFNVIKTEATNLTVLDYFNNTLASEIIDASVYSEYNLYADVYSLYILNQFTYRDLIFNITQVGSGYNMIQLIPASSALLYRFIPNINYTITATYVNETVYNIRTVNLTENSQIESFGVSSEHEEYPKDVYFGVYTTTGLGIDHDLLKFYIDNNRTDFGFNRITDEITSITVKDFFNTTLFSQLVNFSGIYEYDILITLYSLKVKNEARVTSNYTLSYGVLETTGYILPDEIIEYQLSSNNYVFDYTNNEDGNSDTININLNQDRVYILNTTYYDIYFSLFDLNLHIIDSSQYVFRLNSSIQDFGLIEDLTTDDYNITVVDRFGISLFDNIITLRDLNEYRIDITLYELQIRHLAKENGNLTLSETTTHNYFEFLMSPNSQERFILGSSTYNVTWLNNENGITTTYDVNLNLDCVLTLNSTYYDVYIGLYNFYGVVNREEVKFYINSTRADFGFNTIKSETVNLTVLDYFNSILFSQIVRLRDLNEYSIFIQAYTLVVNNLYNNQSITIRMTRGTITLERLIEAQGWTEFKLYPNIAYNIVSYVNGTNDETNEVELIEDEIKIVKLESEYQTVSFGFYETEVPIIPPPIIPDTLNYFIILAMVMIIIGIVVYAKIRSGANKTVRAATGGRYNAYRSFVSSLKNVWEKINWGIWGIAGLLIISLLALLFFIIVFIM